MDWTILWEGLYRLFNHSGLGIQILMAFIVIVVLPTIIFAIIISQLKYFNKEDTGMWSPVDRELVEQEMAIFEEELSHFDKIPFEEKIIAACEEKSTITSPWEVEGYIQEAMCQLPEDLTQEQREAIHDVMYELVTTALTNER